MGRVGQSMSRQQTLDTRKKANYLKSTKVYKCASIRKRLEKLMKGAIWKKKNEKGNLDQGTKHHCQLWVYLEIKALTQERLGHWVCSF